MKVLTQLGILDRGVVTLFTVVVSLFDIFNALFNYRFKADVISPKIVTWNHRVASAVKTFRLKPNRVSEPMRAGSLRELLAERFDCVLFRIDLAGPALARIHIM